MDGGNTKPESRAGSAKSRSQQHQPKECSIINIGAKASGNNHMGQHQAHQISSPISFQKSSTASQPASVSQKNNQASSASGSPSQERPSSPTEIANNNNNNKSNNGENLSFSGCGFLGIYHVGVASCFHEYAPQLSIHKIAGSSAGALVAAAYICGNLQLAYATTDFLTVALEARARTLGPFHPSFDISALIRDALEKGLPDDVHEKVTGKLHISLTRAFDGENVIVSKFSSKEDVIQALLCSCFIPVWSGLVAPKFNGVTYIDGGFSDNQLILDDRTVTVSPFAGEADICPQDEVLNILSVSLSNTSISITPHNLYRLSHALIPPPPEVLSDFCEQGFADGIRYLIRMQLISCRNCINLLVARGYEEEEEIQQAASFIYDTNASPTFANQHQQETHTQTFFESSSLFELEVDNVEAELEDCDDCLLRRKNALRDPLPKLFADRIAEACDKVNKSLSNWFYSHRPIKYLSYIAAPYYLPINVSLAFFLRYWQEIPTLGCELVKCLCEFKDVLMAMMAKANEKIDLPSKLLARLGLRIDEDNGDDDHDMEKHTETTSESSISVKITADCRQSKLTSLTSFECCLTIVLFGRDISTRKSKCV